MLGITLFGLVHTLIAVFALGAGALCLATYHEITPRTASGRIYIGATVATCVTSLGIFHHGGFGKPHALALLTLGVLAFCAWAGRQRLRRPWAATAEVIGYSFTVFLHMVPGITETFTRLPYGAPVFSSPEDPMLAKAVGGCFVIFVIGALLQWRGLRLERAAR
ncbi:hypothetical protein [Roseateles sp.]|uniref:hypothetical protein n=1 Tax=Roseateles sp. TaxID=1971397 RepID=UPI0039E9FB84